MKRGDFLLNPNLTPRELEVLNLVAQGMNNNEIANELFITIHTAKAHVVSILNKLGVKNRTQAVTKAFNKKLIA